MKKPIIGIVAKNVVEEDEDGKWFYQNINSCIRYDILSRGGNCNWLIANK